MARTSRPGRLEPLRFDVPDDQMRFGAATIFDLTRKEVMDGFSCTECGRCQDACPAWATGKILSPKLLIMGVRDQVLAQSTEPIVGNGVPEQMIWDCVTCGACVEACPVSIEHIDHIVDLRRSRVMVDSQFPAEAEPMLRDVERSSNPWGKAQTERAAWADDLGVRVLEPGDRAPEYLYWVGCAASFDERAKKSAQSTAKLLQKAGVDFAILGPREACTGDPARRMGNEYVFQAYAEQNVATLKENRVRKIVASCPHCFNTLANEYGDFGGNYEVLHHTELLAELVRDGKLKPKADAKPITYHDSCYLARHNDVRMEPRELVAAVGQPVEMNGAEPVEIDVACLFPPLAKDLRKALAQAEPHPLLGLPQRPQRLFHGCHDRVKRFVDRHPAVDQGVVPVEEDRPRPGETLRRCRRGVDGAHAASAT